MEQIAVVAHLKSGAEPEAAELLAAGAPFDPEESGFERHVVYLSADEVVFVFEGHEVEWLVDAIVDEPFRWDVQAAFERWRGLVEGTPRIARPIYTWRRDMKSRTTFTTDEARLIGEQIGIDWDSAPFDVEQFREGMVVELEHGLHDPQTNVTGDDPVVTGKIALAHLHEFADYYTRLARMEAEAEREVTSNEADR